MRIFLITGAGISAESGLGTFRKNDGTGIWARFDPMKLASPEAFGRDPAEVHAFYNARRRNLIAAKPNMAHFALARLETILAGRGGKLTLVRKTHRRTPCCRKNNHDRHSTRNSVSEP
jgi:NAD-dependent protein deacetylase/lipoamidase